MNNAGDRTHKPRAVDPKIFRDAATGVGQELAQSVLTGQRRAQRAIDCAPAAQRAVADPSYPAPRMDECGDYLPAGPVSSGDPGEATITIVQGRPVMRSPVQMKRAGR
jgi:hypothetical protein